MGSQERPHRPVKGRSRGRRFRASARRAVSPDRSPGCRPVAAGRARAREEACASSAPISSSVSPMRWAKTMNAIRRSTGRRIAAMARAGPFGRDQAPLLVEAQRRGGDTAAPRDLADRKERDHAQKEIMTRSLTSSLLELVALYSPSSEILEETFMTETRYSQPADHRGGHLLAGRRGRPGQRGEFAFKRRAGARSATCTATTPPTSASRRSVWADLRRQGRIVPHPVFPDSQGPAAREDRRTRPTSAT